MNKKLFSQTVPFNIAKDENIKDLSCVIDNIAIDIKQKTEMVLLLPKLKELPDSILNELAYQFHVDFYREYFDHDTKVKLIESSIATHKIKGTPYAVEKVCTDIFKSAKVIENWEYGGEAYHFKVSFIKEAVTDVSKIDSLMEAISSTKNVRSWCDEIGFITETNNDILFCGGKSIFDKMEISEIKYDLKNGECNEYIKGFNQVFDKINIGERVIING
ncbi:phage tail protein [uncultured Megamonas sp.]|uniref:phage tail protein n=1 Tax=uncultured Megamonas sp. TaxID=286140 RepID=UPI00259B5E81|nr:phage tail protein [uncultured Megamonas sp.]